MLVIWKGQVISILASGMSRFALSIWLFQQTRSATAMGAIQGCSLLPFLALSPLAGALVDRRSRKLSMMIGDIVAVIATGGFSLLTIAWFAQPVAPLLAGLLADRWLEPSRIAETGLSLLFRYWVGASPGSGMALLVIFCGIGIAWTALGG